MGLFQFGGALGSFLIAFLLDKNGHPRGGAHFPSHGTHRCGARSAHDLWRAHAAYVDRRPWRAGWSDRFETRSRGTIYPTYMRAMGAGWGLGIGRRRLVGRSHSRRLTFLAIGIPRADFARSHLHSALLLRRRAFTGCISPSVPKTGAAARCRSPRAANSPTESRSRLQRLLRNHESKQILSGVLDEQTCPDSSDARL